ncbi:MAG: ABC-F family ATP-binding cassette domain-containing protein, partial [Bacilli bacterium]
YLDYALLTIKPYPNIIRYKGMVLLSCNNVKKMFGADTLFDNVCFDIHDNERIAIIGNNGCGKSTLFKIILGEEEKTSGNISFGKNTKIGYLSQDIISSLENTMLEEASLVFSELIKEEKALHVLAKELEKNPHDEGLMKQYGNRSLVFEQNGGYEYSYKIKMILSKFGFSDEQMNRKISTFSGGERVKMAFAKLLLLEPQLLLLDEPTNHLDVSTIDWLERYLLNYRGAILFVSHDKYFINRLASSVLEIDDKTGTLYRGNFDSYYTQKKEHFLQMKKEYKLQQNQIEKMKRFIDYFKEKPRFASRMQDRVKKLEHLDIKNPPKEEKKGISFNFDGSSRADKKIMYFDKVSVGFEDKLVNPFSFLLFGGDKLAIMGDNGTGKTTLLRYITKELTPLDGKIDYLMPLKIGYIKQNDFEFTGNISIIDFFNREFPLLTNGELRNHLGKFNFKGDDVFKTFDVLSGGEKMRILLARIVLMSYDVLLLDEPTNHLDMMTKESLISAMQEFKACIIFVSHDRYFVDSIATKILYFSDNNATIFDGTYSEFKGIEEVLNAPVEKPSIAKEKEESNIVAPIKVKSSKLSNNAIKKLEDELELIDFRLKQITEELNDEENYDDFIKLNELNKEEQELEKRYEDIYLELYEE